MNLLLHKDWSTLRKLLFLNGAVGESLTEYEAEGNPVSFNTNVAKALTGFTVPLLPVQDLHGQSSPYPAGGGKNKYSGGNVSLGGSNSRTKNETIVEIPSGSYYFSCEKTGDATTFGIQLFDSNNQMVAQLNASQISSGSSLSLSSAVVRIYSYMDQTEFDNNKTVSFTNIQIESGSSKTDYAPYENICPISGITGLNIYHGADQTDYDTYAVTFPAEAGTVYGGTLDVVNGTLTVELKKIPLKNRSWSNYSGNKLFYVSLTDKDEYSSTLYSDCFPAVVGQPRDEQTVGTSGAGTSSSKNLYFYKLEMTSFTDFRNWINALDYDPHVCFKLAEPQVFHLDPVTISTLLGDNVIWTDTNGTNEIKYFKKG